MADSILSNRRPMASRPGARPLEGVRPIAGLRFERTFCLLCGWFLGGAYLDGWAHNHIPTLESFFTLWHAILYAGFLAVAIYLLQFWVKHHVPGGDWQEALPVGYELSLAGVVLFALGGIGDMVWHALFGVEASVDALLSPTHLLLMCSAALIFSGPLRAAWRRPDEAASWTARIPMLLSLTFVLSLCTLVTQFAHPFVNVMAARENSSGDPFVLQSLGVAGIMLESAVLTGLVLLVVRRWVLPLGSLTLVFTINAILLSFMQDQYRFIPVALLAGLAADLLLTYLRPSAERLVALRLFAFAMPAILYLLYFIMLMLTGGIWWTIHLWLGSTVMAGIVGYLLSYLLVPPAPISSPPSVPSPPSVTRIGRV